MIIGGGMGYPSIPLDHWTPKAFEEMLFGKNLGGREGSRIGKRKELSKNVVSGKI